MTGADRIRDLLRRAARDGRLPAAAGATPEAALARFAEAVDAAVLARRLRLHLDGEDLVCAVAARRLLSFEAPAPAGLPAGSEALFGRTLAAEDAGAVAALLRGLADRGGRFELSATAPDTGPEPALGGIAAATLAAALGLAPAEGAADPLAAGLAALAEGVIAALLIEDEGLTLLAGDSAAEALADEAGALLDRVLVPEFPLLATLETAGALTFTAPGAERHLLLAGHLGRFVLAAVAGADAADTLARWRAVALD